MGDDAKYVRENAPQFIRSVIEETKALPEIDSVESLRDEQIDALGGGVDAATYLVKSKDKQVVIKLSTNTIEAEAEALKAWKEQGALVPEVSAHGTVPASKEDDPKVMYLVQEAITDENGRIAETAANLLTYSPDKAREVGRLLGNELKKMHGAVSDRSFGDFVDSTGNTAPFKTWNAYISGYLDEHRDYLKEIGVSDEQLSQLQKFIDSESFVSQGVYLHGDFSIRNAAIRSYKPLKVFLFDPNPIVGDPAWDVAVLVNNYEYQKRQMEHGADNQDLHERYKDLHDGFWKGYSLDISQQSLKLSQFFHTILQAQYKADKVEKDEADTVELQVRKELIYDLLGQLTKGVTE